MQKEDNIKGKEIERRAKKSQDKAALARSPYPFGFKQVDYLH